VPTKTPAKAAARTDLPTPTKLARRGMLLVLSSPSGAGKTTLAKALLASDPGIRLSVSVTTRKPRPGEVDGKDYFFRDEAGFLAMRDNGELLEWAKVFGNYYATPLAPVADAVASGQDVLFDIDWQGTQQVKEKLPQDLVRVFILPPSSGVLESRLKTRAQDTDEVVAQRNTTTSSSTLTSRKAVPVSNPYSSPSASNATACSAYRTSFGNCSGVCESCLRSYECVPFMGFDFISEPLGSDGVWCFVSVNGVDLIGLVEVRPSVKFLIARMSGFWNVQHSPVASMKTVHIKWNSGP
jgi:guanylate kinase